MLTARQMNEIVAFDWERRTSGHYDCRRYGSVTEQPRGGEPVAEHPIRKTLRYNYIVPARGGEVNVLHVAVRLDGRFVPCVKVVARWNIAKGTVEARDLEYHGIAGWIVVWAERDWRRRKFCDIIVDKTAPVARPGVVVDPKWVNYGKWKYNSGLAFPFHETVNLSALVGTKYQYCQYESGRCKTGLVDWLMLYRREPKVELLAKAGLYMLINPLGLDALRDKCVFAWVRDHAKEVEDCYSPTREIVYAARHGTTLADADRHFAVTESLKRFVAGVRRHIWNNAPDDVVRRGSGFVRKSSLMRIDYERLAAMLRKWHVDGSEWERYVCLAYDCGLDLRNEGTVYPPVADGRKTFMERLERLEAQHARNERLRRRRERAAERKRIRDEEERIARVAKTRVEELAEFERSALRAKVMDGTGYKLVVAKSQDELRTAGKRLHNCVGCGTYGRGLILGDCVILILNPRKKKDRAVCIEINRVTWQVRQCYYEHNERVDDSVRSLADRLAKTIKAAFKRCTKIKKFKDLYTKGKAA